MEDIKVSVIVPIYNVERFIAICAESLFRQSLQGVEYIFVDDATTDGSMEELQETAGHFPSLQACIKIVRHKVNRGLPAARNTGLAIAEGEYIFHCDSDDFVEPQMLETLYSKAKERDADIVWCDWFLSFENTERLMRQPAYSLPDEAVKAMLGGVMKFNVWNKLARRSLYVDNDIWFPEGYGMGEDMTMIMLFAEAQKVVYVSGAFYHYVKTNTNAFSRTYSDRHLSELRYNVDRIERFIKERFGSELDEYLAFMKLEAKFPLLLSEDSHKLSLWRRWYSEANVFIMKNKRISLRNRLLQWCASKNLMWAVRLYSFMFNRIVYGMLYK